MASVLKSTGFLWVLTLVITRLHILHNAYIHHRQRIEDESWLLLQCQDPAFYANLKQHVKLCTEVQENKSQNSFLVALNETMAVTSMCGTVSCTDLWHAVRDGGLSLATSLVVIAIIMVVIILPLINLGLRIIGERNYFIESNYPCVERGGGWHPPTRLLNAQQPPHAYAMDGWDAQPPFRSLHLIGGVVQGAASDKKCL